MAGCKPIIESCRSCRFQYKDKLNNVRMCCKNQRVTRQTHTNQNGHVRDIGGVVTGHASCILVTKGAKRCRKGYQQHPRKPQEIFPRSV